MANARLGCNLPYGTTLHYFSCYDVRSVTVSKKYDDNYIFEYFLEDDGLWATPRARSFWKEFPQFHPHSSLFDILYKKLESS